MFRRNVNTTIQNKGRYRKMKLLMHTCCAPCSVYCIDSLRSEGIEQQYIGTTLIYIHIWNTKQEEIV